jgi:cell division protease FtsH
MNDPSQKPDKSKPKGAPVQHWRLFKAVVSLLVIAGILFYFLKTVARPQNQVQGTVPTFTYETFKAQLRLGNVEKIKTSGDQIEVWLKEPLEQNLAGSLPTPQASRSSLPTPAGSFASGGAAAPGAWDTNGFNPDLKKGVADQAANNTHFKIVKPSIEDPGLMPLLEERQVSIESVSPQNSSPWTGILYLLVLLAFIPLGFILLQRFSAPQRHENLGGMTNSPARSYKLTDGQVTFEDVAGSYNVKQELQEVIEFLKNPQRFNRLGAKIPKGVLLVGPPGTGKTLLARAVAGEAEVPFLSLSGSDFMELYVGVGAARVRKLFEQAKKSAPTIIFIDELDSIGRRRSSGSMPGNEERDQTLNQLLSEMDGFSPSDNVIVLGATNRPEILDPALQRPGRFDRQVVVDNPTLQDRAEILRIHARGKIMAPEVDLEEVARGTPGLSGADLANLLNEAALLAVRKSKDQIGPTELSEARDKVLIGLERNVVLHQEDVRLIAYHEAGHALVGAVLPHADPIHKVTIIPRGMAMGVTQQLPERDRFLYSSDYLLDYISVMMGGRAAEELALGVMTSGASNDLKQATHLARKMVLEWGMSPRFGAIFLGNEESSFLGDFAVQGRSFSETTAREVDEEIRSILEEAYARAKRILVERRPALERLVEALLEKEQIQGEEVYALLQDVDRQDDRQILQ